MRPSTVLVALAVVVSSRASLASAPLEPPLWAKEAALTRYVFGRDGSIADEPLACAAAAGPCAPGATQLRFVAPAAVPPLASCASNASALMACYAGAVERLQEALDQGDSTILFESAQRAKDVAARADATPSAPLWMRTASPSNLLVHFFLDRGMPLGQLGACATGSEAARYLCLGSPAGPPASVYRAAIDLLDHHSDLVVNWGATTGARARLEHLFRSAIAPTTAQMTATNLFDPRRGPGMIHVDLLGKLSYLRVLTGEVGATLDAEKAYLDGIVGYQGVDAHLALFAAQRAARWTDPASRETSIIDAAIDGEVASLLTDAAFATHLQLIRGAVGAASVSAQLAAHYAATRRTLHFDSDGLVQRFTSSLALFTATMPFSWTAGSDHCEWFTVDDIVWSITAYYPVVTTSQLWVPDCLPHQDGCDSKAGHSDTVTTTTWVAGATTTRTLGQDIDAKSIRESYRELLESDDGRGVDVDGVGGPDIDLSRADNATIAHAGISATECLAEVANVSSGYHHTITSSDLSCGASPCKGQFDGPSVQLFLPYALAARLCPDYTANAVGINAVTLVSGQLRGVDKSCPTPLEFVATVADTLEHAPSDYIDALDANLGAIEGLLADFAAEGDLLTAPVAGMRRQRADLAYFSAEPLGSCADNPTGQCVGLDVLDARLGAALDPLAKGMALHAQFSRIDRSETLQGDAAIATFAADAIGVCKACGGGTCPDCQSSSQNQIRALAYRRQRDMLGIYQSLRSDQLELLWRRMDAMPASCVAPVDTNGDGVVDTNRCNTSDLACTAFCPSYTAATALVAATTADLATVVSDLTAQQTIVDSLPRHDLSTLIADLAGWASGISTGTSAKLAAIDSGVDWLGDKKGRWAVVMPDSGTIDDEIEAQLSSLEVDAQAVTSKYDTWVAGYLAELSQTTALGNIAQTVEASVETNIAAYCNHTVDGTPAIEQGACGLGVALDETNPTAQRINGVIDTQFCNVQVDEFAAVTASLTDPSSIGYVTANNPYVAWGASIGIPICPHLATVDVDALTATYNGTLISGNVSAMQRALLDLEAAIKDYHGYVALMQRTDVIFDSYNDAVSGTLTGKAATREWLRDTMICGVEVLGATALDVLTGGSAIPIWVGAAVACGKQYAANTDALIPNDGNLTPDEVNMEAAFTNQQVTEADQLYTASEKLETVILRIADYKAVVLAYRSELSAYQRAIAYGNSALDTLGAYQVFDDPTYMAFEQQELTSLKSAFRGFARQLQDVERTIVYELANDLPTGAAYARSSSEQYWMPRLADITIASAHGSDAPAAYEELVAPGGIEPPAEVQTLVAAASLIQKIVDDFHATYGYRLEGESAEIGYIGSSVSGLLDTNSDGLQDTVLGVPQYANPGELAMLGDSRFYAASVTTAGGCRIGWVDLHDYCATFAGTAVATAAGQCADLRTMTVTQRLGLAHLDHMTRTPGRETFACTVDAAGGYHIAAGTGAGVNGVFTTADLPTVQFDTQHWQRGVGNTVDEAFYAAQTATVRRLIDDYLEAIQDPRYALAPNVTFWPGTFLYQVDMTSPAMEPEADVLTGLPAAATTMSEQLDAMAVICTSSSCGGANPTQTELVVFGPGYKGTRCRYMASYADAMDLRYPSGAARQAQLAFDMDDDLIAGPISSLAEASPESNVPAVQAALAGSGVLQRPLHATRFLFGVAGLYDGAQNASGTTWALYAGGTEPRLRIAVRYSQYSTDAVSGPDAIDLDQFLTCPANTERM